MTEGKSHGGIYICILSFDALFKTNTFPPINEEALTQKESKPVSCTERQISASENQIDLGTLFTTHYSAFRQPGIS